MDTITKEVTPKMQASIDNFALGLSRIRTGRANPSILDGVMVSYYGNNTSLREVASITTPEASQILIKPWDRGVLSAIETAIRNSDVGLAPINDGSGIRLSLPPMTEERRREIVGQVKKMGEEAKVSVRNVRKEAWDKVQSGLKNKEITEDDKYQAEEDLNKITAEMNKEIDRIVFEKENEIMKI
jgi:ribosome recycling factor